jgi:PPM family protein phosphatase
VLDFYIDFCYNDKIFKQFSLVQEKILQLDCFGITDIGLVREHNEDFWAAYPEERLFILADGMGGHRAGEIAAKEATEYLYTLFKKWHPEQDISVEALKFYFKETFSKVNANIYKEGERNEDLRGMGTTLCSLFFHQNEAILAHVGDSRIYLLREKKLQQLTEDHSLLFELLSLGAIQPQDVEHFPYKHILTRAIGTHPQVETTIDTIQVEPHDIFLLSSDGLTNYVTDEQIERLLNSDASLKTRGEALVDLAIKQGGGDNITLILVDTLA